MNRHVALKVVKSAPRYTETALDEIKLLQRLISPASSSPHPGSHHVISFLDHFKHKGPNGTHICMVFEVLGENLLGLIKRHQSKGVPTPLVKQIAKQVLLGLDYMHRVCGVIHTDLKPENVLICIDDVEAVVRAELGDPDAPGAAIPTKLVGVPPSKGRGGNQTPRSESISVYITGSQPLPSPSSSFGSSPMFDKWAFGMSKIDSPAMGKASSGATSLPSKTALASQSDPVQTAADAISDVQLDGPSSNFNFTSSPTSNKVKPPYAGPSLLSQQAPPKTSSHQPSDVTPDDHLSRTQLRQSPQQRPMTPPATEPTSPYQDQVNPPTQVPLASSAMSMTTDVPMAAAAQLSQDLEIDWDSMPLERITVKIADLGNACWVGMYP